MNIKVTNATKGSDDRCENCGALVGDPHKARCASIPDEPMAQRRMRQINMQTTKLWTQLGLLAHEYLELLAATDEEVQSAMDEVADQRRDDPGDVELDICIDAWDVIETIELSREDEETSAEER